MMNCLDSTRRHLLVALAWPVPIGAVQAAAPAPQAIAVANPGLEVD